MPSVSTTIRYPTSDGRPMAETDLHRDLMVLLIQMLEAWFANQPLVYVSGNLLLYYVPGDKRRHVSPDVFVVRGVKKDKRDYYLVWEEGQGPTVVLELTSASTRREDVKKKFELYRDVLKVPEYFLFDPRGEYLTPRLQGYRWVEGQYVAIPLTDGRLPSEQLGLHLEPEGTTLRLYDPVTGQWLPTPGELLREKDQELYEKDLELLEKDQELRVKDQGLHAKDQEILRLQAELAKLRKGQ